MHPFVYVADCRFMVFLWTCLIQMGDSPRFPRGTPKEGQSSAMACSASRLSMDKQVWLVVSTPLKNMLVSWDDDIPNIWKNKTCSKPPIRSLSNLSLCLRFQAGG